MPEWLTIEVFDGEVPASGWRRAYDDALIEASVARTGRAIVVHEAQRSGGLGAEIAARVQERCFYSLEAPVLRVTGYDMPYPPSRAEKAFLPDLDRILDGVDRSLAY